MDIPEYIRQQNKRNKIKIRIAALLKEDALLLFRRYERKLNIIINNNIESLTSSQFKLLIQDFANDISNNINNIKNSSVDTYKKLYNEIKSALDIKYPLDYKLLPGTLINNQQIINEVQAVIRKFRSGELTEERMRRTIAKRLHKPAAVANTIANTQISSWDNQATKSVADLAFLKHFLYSGPVSNNSRDFCIENVGQIFTESQIRALDNGQGLSVMSYVGGFNCMHELIPVDPEWKEVKKYKLAA